MIAGMISGKVEGDSDIKVNTISGIDSGEAGSLGFLANPAYEKHIYNTGCSVVMVKEDFEPREKVKATLIRVKDPYLAFAMLLEQYGKLMANPFEGIHPSASIDPTASIGNNVTIHPQVNVGPNAVIGDGTVLNAGVRVMHRCVVGNNCIIHAGAVIGSDGFGFAPVGSSEYRKVPQIGNVVLEDNVEIGANTTIDRATMGSTTIKAGAKLDNLVQIAHNVEIGESTVIAAQSGVAGSTTIGKNCMIGGQVGIIGHLTIGKWSDDSRPIRDRQ